MNTRAFHIAAMPLALGKQKAVSAAAQMSVAAGRKCPVFGRPGIEFRLRNSPASKRKQNQLSWQSKHIKDE